MRVDSITRHGHGNIETFLCVQVYVRTYKYRFNVISLKQINILSR